MDDKKFDFDNIGDDLSGSDYSGEINPEEDEAEDDVGKTREMDSVLYLKPDSIEGITPREEFAELNYADDMQKTRSMDSIDVPNVQEEQPPAENVIKRRKKKHHTNHTRTMGQIFLGVVISVASLCIGVVLAVNVIGAMRDFTGMAKGNREVEFEITDDMSVNDIANKLHDAGVINMPSLFKSYLNFAKENDGFLSGTYTIYTNMSYSNLIDTLKTPKEYTETVMVQIREGLTAAEVGKILEENYVCRAVDFEKYYKSKLNKFDFEEGIKDNPYRLNMLEGYLFPDTYEFYVIDDLKKNPNFDTTEYAKIAAETMYENFESKITKSMKSRMKELGLSLDEVVILASLVQWEGNDEESMANISSVFQNRLADPEGFPNLQSDTTYTYIDRCIVPNINSSNKEKMQQIEEAYDTYKCQGLPAGAICNPGLDAINAVLYPADTNYYYFLVSSEGLFYWAQTHEQHEQNIRDAALHAASEEE